MWFTCPLPPPPRGKLTRPLSVRRHPAPPHHTGLASLSHQATIVLAACVQYGHGRVGCHRGTPAAQHTYTPLRALGVLRPNANYPPIWGAKFVSRMNHLKLSAANCFPAPLRSTILRRRRVQLNAAPQKCSNITHHRFRASDSRLYPGGMREEEEEEEEEEEGPSTVWLRAHMFRKPRLPKQQQHQYQSNLRCWGRKGQPTQEPGGGGGAQGRFSKENEEGNGQRKEKRGRGEGRGTSLATSLARSMPLHKGGGRRRRAFYIGCSRHEGSLN